MKKTALLILFCLIGVLQALAQTSLNSDSVAYQLQRQKINNMLTARKQKFGQYEQSLSQHTGIFGFQTKDDIRRSANILMDIAKTDDNIFRELKILLEYRDFQQRQIQNHSREAETTAAGYMEVISRLQKQNAKLKADLQLAQQHQGISQTVYMVIGVLILASILIRLFIKSRVKA